MTRECVVPQPPTKRSEFMLVGRNRIAYLESLARAPSPSPERSKKVATR
jgi:hypothetical protein